MAKLALHGIQLERIDQIETSQPAQSSLVLVRGDYVLSGAGVRVVIGGSSRAPAQWGSVLEFSREGAFAPESSLRLVHVLYVAGVARPIHTRRMAVVERAGTPALRIEGSVHLGQGGIDVARELSLARVAGGLSVSLRASTQRAEGARDLRFGARIEWGGPSPFVAGVGQLEDENFHRADWVAAQAARTSAVFGFERGGLSARAGYELYGSERLPLHTDVVESRSFGLVAGVPHYDKSGLLLSPLGLSDAVRKLGFWRGRGFPVAWAHLPYRPEGAEVRLRDERGRLLLNGRPDAAGNVALPLVPLDGRVPPRYGAQATAYGHAESDPQLLSPGAPPFVLRIPRGGQVRLRVRDSHDGEPLAARARFLALGEQPPVMLGPDYRASGAGDTVVSLHGQVSVPVPPGRYQVLITHGPEWSLHESEVEVTETFSPLVEAALNHQVDAGPFVACDLHVHSALSPDSQVSIADRLVSLAAEGVQFAVPTDHNHVTDYAPTVRELSLHDFATVSGVEITTWDPALGHFNAYPYPIDALKPGAGAPDHTHIVPSLLFEALHRMDPDMVVQINHPRLEGGIGYFDVMRLDARTGAADPRFSPSFDAVEVFNGFDLARPAQVNAVFRDWLTMLARGQRVAATGSSDSHQVRYQLAGYPRTYARVAELSRGDGRAIVRAIKRGESFITSGPFLEASIQGVGPGGTASSAESSVALSVRVRAPSWMPVDRLEIYVGGGLVYQSNLLSAPLSGQAERPIERFSGSIDLHLERDAFVVVRVESAESLERFFGRTAVLPMAFTNPIFVDRDGDGRTPWSGPN